MNLLKSEGEAKKQELELLNNELEIGLWNKDGEDVEFWNEAV